MLSIDPVYKNILHLYLLSVMVQSLWRVFFSKSEYMLFLLITLSLNSFCNEISRTWPSLTPETRYDLLKDHGCKLGFGWVQVSLASYISQNVFPRWKYVKFLSLELRDSLGGWSLFPTNKKWGSWKGFCTQEDPTPFHSPLFSDTPQSWGEHYGTRKEIKFWIERSIIDLLGELGFTGTQIKQSSSAVSNHEQLHGH